jgi:hypothetical protein
VDEELTAFIARAVQPLALQLAGAAGDAVRAGVARLLGRDRPEREATQLRALTAKIDSASPEALQEWLAGRLESVLEDQPELAGRLADLAGITPPSQAGRQTNIATGNATQPVLFSGTQTNNFGRRD